MAQSIPPKQRTLLYRRAVFSAEDGDSATTLESLLKAGLARKKKVSARFQGVGDDQQNFINYHLLHDLRDGEANIFGCEFLSYKKGEGQTSLHIDPEAEQLNVSLIPAGEGKEFVDGAVYFAVKGNHIVLFKSRSLGTQELESYLNWIIYGRKGLTEGKYVYVSDHISESAKKTIRGAKGIKLSSPVQMVSVERGSSGRDIEEVATGEAVEEHRSVKVRPAGAAWDAFKAFLSTVADFDDRFTVEDLARIPDLQVSMSLHWKGKRNETEGEFLDGIATQMRHVEDEIEYQIETKDGFFSPKTARNAKLITIRWTDENRPDFGDLFPKMAEWLASLLSNAKVDP